MFSIFEISYEYVLPSLGWGEGNKGFKERTPCTERSFSSPSCFRSVPPAPAYSGKERAAWKFLHRGNTNPLKTEVEAVRCENKCPRRPIPPSAYCLPYNGLSDRGRPLGVGGRGGAPLQSLLPFARTDLQVSLVLPAFQVGSSCHKVVEHAVERQAASGQERNTCSQSTGNVRWGQAT